MSVENTAFSPNVAKRQYEKLIYHIGMIATLRRPPRVQKGSIKWFFLAHKTECEKSEVKVQCNKVNVRSKYPLPEANVSFMARILFS